MSHCDRPSNAPTNYLSESEQESFFSLPKPTKTHSPIGRPPINKRLLGGRQVWSHQERQRYVAFLKEQFDLVDRPAQERSALQVYWLMAAALRSKTHAQCRIRHAALLRRYGNTENVIRACQRDLEGNAGRVGKMQQYGLRVAVEEEGEQEGREEEQQLWTVLQSSQWSYYQNGYAL